MTRLFAAESQAVLAERLQHIAVADLGFEHPDAVLTHRNLETQVAHDGRNERVVGQRALRLHRNSEDRHDLVPVDHRAVRVYREAAISVTVVGDAEVGAVRQHRGREPVEVSRSDTVVDVGAVGIGTDDSNPGARIREHLRCYPRGRTVRAIQHHVQPVEALGHRPEEVEHVTVFGIGEATDASDFDPRGCQVLLAECRLDAVFDDIGQLGAARREELDAVIGGRVVRRRHHDTEVGADVSDEEGEGWGRDDSRIQYVYARTSEASRHRGDDELTRDTRIPGHDRNWPAP